METSSVMRGDQIRVMLLTSSLERGGAERQVVLLANALDEERFDVRVCSLSAEVPLAANLDGAAQRMLIEAKRHKYDVGLILRVARLLRRLRIDVVHSFMFDAEMVGRLAGRLAGVPAVICSNRCPHWQRAAFKLRLARWTRQCFDLMIANSHAGMAFERHCQHVSEGKLCVVPNGVDTERFHPGRADELRDRLGIARDALVVGMVAHFRGNKDHATFIEAAARVAKACPQAVFVCIGKPDGFDHGSRFQRAVAQAERLGITERMRFAGDRDDVAQCYRMFDVKVLCTHFEGTPNVVLEAMASGLPVVVSDVSDNRRIVEDGVCGYVVKEEDVVSVADRVLEILGDSELRTHMGEAARKHAVEQFSVRRMAERTADAYVRVLRSKGRVKAAVDAVAAPGGEA